MEGLIIESPAASGTESNPAIAGYSILAKSFSTEFGGPCVWIEDIYLREEYRGCGAGSAVLSFVKAQHPEAVITRLEVETENVPAMLETLWQRSTIFVSAASWLDSRS